MKWKNLEGKTIVSVVANQIPAASYPEPIEQDNCWTYGLALTFSDGTSATIKGIQHDEAGGIELEGTDR